MVFWDSKDINEEQEVAILQEGSVLLIACPGSGKTRTLTYKIAHELLKLKSKKKFVIAITYTHRAAEEIKDRIENLGISTDQLWIGTIHSFCMEWILRPYSLYVDELKHGFTILNSQETEDILDVLCAPYPKITHFDCSYIITSQGYRLDTTDGKRSTVDKILHQYWDILVANKQIDFELILFHSYQLLINKPFISETLSRIFHFVLMDEYQDTKEIQYQICSLILKAAKGGLNAFVVGDPNQSIYTSLGGYAIKKEDLEVLTRCKFKQLSLSGNYRSSDIIISYFDNFKTFANTITGLGENKLYSSKITRNITVTKDGLDDEIVRLILYNIQERQISPNEICIVAPQWVHLASLTRRLMVKLPDYSFNGPGMAPFARDIDNFFYKLSRILLTEPSPHIYNSRLRWATELLFELNTLDIGTAHITKKDLLRICNSIHIEEADGIKYLKACIEILFQHLQIDYLQFKLLADHYDAFFRSSENRITKLVKEGSDYISTTENFKKVFKQREGITISTIHGVKGAEFDTVIAFALLQDYVPHFSEKDGDNAAKKSLYVICSRAKKNLHLISEKGRLKNYGNPRPEYQPTNQLALVKYHYDVC